MNGLDDKHADTLRSMRPTIHHRPTPEADLADTEPLVPRVVCPIGRGWLVGWKEIGAYCGFGGKKQTSANRTGRDWENRYALPIHRIPGNRRPRAIPWELDQWLVAFAEIAKRAQRHEPSVDHMDWRKRREEMEEDG